MDVLCSRHWPGVDKIGAQFLAASQCIIVSESSKANFLQCLKYQMNIYWLFQKSSKGLASMGLFSIPLEAQFPAQQDSWDSFLLAFCLVCHAQHKGIPGIFGAPDLTLKNQPKR